MLLLLILESDSLGHPRKLAAVLFRGATLVSF